MSNRTGGINTLAWIVIAVVGVCMVCVVAQWAPAVISTLVNQ